MKKVILFGLIALGLTACYTPDDLRIGDTVVARGDDFTALGQVVGINRYGLIAFRCGDKYYTASRDVIVKLPYEGPVCVPKL